MQASAQFVVVSLFAGACHMAICQTPTEELLHRFAEASGAETIVQPIMTLSDAAAEGIASDRINVLRPTSDWTCDNAMHGDRHLCEHAPIIGNIEYRFSAGDGLCGACWCCKRRLQACQYRLINPGPFMSNQMAQDNHTGCPAKCPEMWPGSVATRGWISYGGTSFCWCESCGGSTEVQHVIRTRKEMADQYLRGEIDQQKREITKAAHQAKAAQSAEMKALNIAGKLQEELVVEQNRDKRLFKLATARSAEADALQNEAIREQEDALEELHTLTGEQIIVAASMAVLLGIAICSWHHILRVADADRRLRLRTPLLSDAEAPDAARSRCMRVNLAAADSVAAASDLSSDVEVVEAISGHETADMPNHAKREEDSPAIVDYAGSSEATRTSHCRK